MKPCRSNQNSRAMTLVEVLVVFVVLAVLVGLFLPALDTTGHKRISCVNNLREIGLDYRIWAGDNGDKYPMEVSVTNGGTIELVTEGKNTWLNYLIMSNELGTPKILICPQDTEHQPPAINFSPQIAGHISYFVGLDANETYPQMFLSGDDNFEISGAPIKSGLLELSTNTSIAWSAARHKFSGNIGLADGSVQEVNTDGLQKLFIQTGLATNRLAIP
jgi:prepilin-type processing-associated H-X9-DG protein